MSVSTETCCLCGVALTTANDSEEHVILRSLGGRKTVSGVLCRGCNERAGVTWDAELARQLKPLCLFFRISRQGSARPRQVFETSGGQKIAVTGDGLELPGPTVSVRDVDGSRVLRIQARNEQEARGILEGQKRKHFPQLDVEATLAQGITDQSNEYLSDYIKMQLSVGGLVAGRSIVKSAFVLAVHSGVPEQTIKEGREYLLGDDTPCFDYIARLDDPVLHRPANSVLHCVAVQSTNGMLLGYVEYFSIYRILICLSKHYDGPPIHQVVAVNPLDGSNPEIDVVLNVTLAEVEDIFADPKHETAFMQRLLGAAIKVGQRRQLELEHPKAVERAMEKAWATLGLRDGQELSPSDLQRFVRGFAEAITPFYLHAANMGFAMTPTSNEDAGEGGSV